MDGQYPPPIPPLGAYYPSGYPPMMPPEALQQPHRLQQMQTMSMESLGSYSDYDEPNRTMLPPQAPPRSRRRQPQGAEHVKHRRTRSGCYTCRQRRVKCDETHPICDRCRKGKRECNYPGSVATPITVAKSSKNSSRIKDSPSASSPSGSEDEFEEKEALPSIPDEEDDDDSVPTSSTSDIRQASNASPPSREIASASRRPQPQRSNSRQSTRSEIFQSPRWNGLPKEVKRYLHFHHEHMSHHHYAFKYDGGDFLKTTFLEIAMNDGSAALLYAIVAFAAYHQSIAHDDGNISVFLSYYNKSIAFLQQSLKRQRHSVATLLTILQLATIEEFLGDWLNLLGHQKAAYSILTDLFTPQTIMQDETRRKIITWYIRFDLFAGIMAGGETQLGREWFAASAEFYERQTRDKPTDLGARFEKYFADSRLLATDVALLFAGKTKNTISDEDFAMGLQKLSTQFADFGHEIEHAFTDSKCFIKSFPDAPEPQSDDLFDFRDPEFLYAGELSTMNFVLIDHWAIDLMFKYQTSLAMGREPGVELTSIALKKAKMFEAIQYGASSQQTAVLGCQASLGIMALFLPKDPAYMTWCRRKFALIEQLGYIYPSNFRSRMSEHWAEDVTRWWLPNDEGYPTSIRTIRDFVEYRATRPTDALGTGISNMSGIFRSLHIDEHGFSDDLKSAGTESIEGSVSPLLHGTSPEQALT
ncbi:hypothetical protein AC578_4208 [Pseudocercospora eumusae]|uniref:Zn(2)-C6 fungal-type domain-containing protein n=1 Tax=Pseudocercospora eumusae TaxID=321146 RepID=A0A139GTY7_9PEZI|nr:hypothetical protein AC578_4208 [Pseudocercospora eumusae]